jgi:hypothetical protein
MENPVPPFHPDPRAKKWLFVQLLGGVVAMAGILACVYALARQKEAREALHVPGLAWIIPAGVLIHALGRLGVRRLGR